jgi:hypothetical protein
MNDDDYGVNNNDMWRIYAMLTAISILIGVLLIAINNPFGFILAIPAGLCLNRAIHFYNNRE